MLVRNYPTTLRMFFIEEMFKERTYTNIFRQLSLYDFWNNNEGSCNLTPKDFGRTDSREVCIEVVKPNQLEHQLIFNLEAQCFADLGNNIKRKYEKVKFARWYA